MLLTLTGAANIESLNSAVATSLFTANETCYGIVPPVISDIDSEEASVWSTWMIAVIVVGGMGLLVVGARSYQQYQLRQYDLSLTRALIETGGQPVS